MKVDENKYVVQVNEKGKKVIVPLFQEVFETLDPGTILELKKEDTFSKYLKSLVYEHLLPKIGQSFKVEIVDDRLRHGKYIIIDLISKKAYKQIFITDKLNEQELSSALKIALDVEEWTSFNGEIDKDVDANIIEIYKNRIQIMDDKGEWKTLLKIETTKDE